MNFNKMKNIECKHIKKIIKKAGIGIYSYNLVGIDLYLCAICEKKLRKQILKQNEIEDK